MNWIRSFFKLIFKFNFSTKWNIPIWYSINDESQPLIWLHGNKGMFFLNLS